MAPEAWRVALITTAPPVAEFAVPTLRGLGLEPVAVISARHEQPIAGRAEMSDSTVPPGVDMLIARDKWSMEPLLRAVRPDLAVCWGFPWRIPLPALQVPRLGSINGHPALLRRHRGPIPVSWALREGDGRYGVTWHRLGIRRASKGRGRPAHHARRPARGVTRTSLVELGDGAIRVEAGDGPIWVVAWEPLDGRETSAAS